MMKKPTIEDLQKELATANKRMEILEGQLREQFAIRSLIIAANLLSEEKFFQAEDFLIKE